MTVDRELVTRKLLLITQDLDAAAPLATRPLATFLESRVDQAVVERLLERMIGRMIDVNYHLNWRPCGSQRRPYRYRSAAYPLGNGIGGS